MMKIMAIGLNLDDSDFFLYNPADMWLLIISNLILLLPLISCKTQMIFPVLVLALTSVLCCFEIKFMVGGIEFAISRNFNSIAVCSYIYSFIENPIYKQAVIATLSLVLSIIIVCLILTGIDAPWIPLIWAAIVAFLAPLITQKPNRSKYAAATIAVGGILSLESYGDIGYACGIVSLGFAGLLTAGVLARIKVDDDTDASDSQSSEV